MIWCPTWGEMKCVAHAKRIYNPENLSECKEYVKRPSNFEERPCQCKDCLTNEKLSEEDVNE